MMKDPKSLIPANIVVGSITAIDEDRSVVGVMLSPNENAPTLVYPLDDWEEVMRFVQGMLIVAQRCFGGPPRGLPPMPEPEDITTTH